MGEVPQGKRQPVALIPAYNPPRRMVELVNGLRRHFPRIVVVDDGSVEGLDVLAEVEGMVEKVLRHGENRGKGAALKTGLAYIGGENTVTVDADGQHTLGDVLAVAGKIESGRPRLVLGARGFSGKVPLRSRFGNFWTRWFFFLATGLRLRDTQTGLRGIPDVLVKRLLTIPGERYEYEMAVLADARHHDEKPLEVPIETVYLDGNSTSHFKPLADTVRIYRSFLGYCASGVMSFILDNAVFALSMWWMSAHHSAPRSRAILFSIFLARIVSANFNYLCNRFMVFRRERSGSGGAKRSHHSYFSYFALVAAVAAAGYVCTAAASAVAGVDGVAVTSVKIVVEAALFVLGYHLQRKVVFRRQTEVFLV